MLKAVHTLEAVVEVERQFAAEPPVEARRGMPLRDQHLHGQHCAVLAPVQTGRAARLAARPATTVPRTATSSRQAWVGLAALLRGGSRRTAGEAS